MKTRSNSPGPHRAAFTRIELFVATLIIGLLAAVLIPSLVRMKRDAGLGECQNNLKLVGLAFRIWTPDANNAFPMARSVADGGSMEVANDVWRTFILMSNELNAPNILVCPADKRLPASSWESLSNTNISYFLCLEASETEREVLLAGDRHLTTGLAATNHMLTLSSNTPAGWTHELHQRAGNVALSDGSVQGGSRQKADNASLQHSVNQALRRRYDLDTTATLRLAMPE